MNYGEKFFRVLSVMTLTLGAFVALAGSKALEVSQLSKEVQTLLSDAKSASEVNRINQGVWEQQFPDSEAVDGSKGRIVLSYNSKSQTRTMSPGAY